MSGSAKRITAIIQTYYHADNNDSRSVLSKAAKLQLFPKYLDELTNVHAMQPQFATGSPHIYGG